MKWFEFDGLLSCSAVSADKAEGIAASDRTAARIATTDDTTRPQPLRFRLTPGHCLLALLAVEFLLFLSQCFRWLPKGWPVLIAIASVGVVVLGMFVWFGVASVFRRRFQFSLLSLLVLVVVVALPFSWLAAEMKKAREQKEAVEILLASECLVGDDGLTDENGNFDFSSVGWRWTAKNVPTARDEGPLGRLLGRNFFHSTKAIKRLPFLISGNELAIPFSGNILSGIPPARCCLP